MVKYLMVKYHLSWDGGGSPILSEAEAGQALACSIRRPVCKFHCYEFTICDHIVTTYGR
jgi:hypothetical protein